MFYYTIHNNVRIIASIDESKIGYRYPVVFFPCGDGEYAQLDIILRATFKLSAEDWSELEKQATRVSPEQFADEIGQTMQLLDAIAAQSK